MKKKYSKHSQPKFQNTMDASNASKVKKVFGMYKKQKDKQKEDTRKMLKEELEKNNIVLESMFKKLLEKKGEEKK